MASENIIEQFHTACNQAIKHDISELTTNPDWGAINFKDCVEDISETRKFIKLWMHVDVSIVPDSTLSQHRSRIQQFGDILDNIKQFKIAQNPEATKNRIAASLASYREQMIPITAHWLPFLYHQKDAPDLFTDKAEKRLKELEAEVAIFESDRQRIQNEDDERIRGYEERINQILSDYEDTAERSSMILSEADNSLKDLIQTTHEKTYKLEEDANAVIQAARKVAAEKAVAPYTHSFHNAARKWKIQAIMWLTFTGATLIATGLWAYNGLTGQAPALSNITEMIQYFSARVLITLLLVSAIWWSAKQFRIAKHQQTTNQHKADALRSFEAFIEATNSPDVRDAVILQTTQTIFGQQPTGYLDGKEESSFEQYAKVAQSINSAAQITSKAS